MTDKNPIQKTLISDAQLTAELFKLFESGNTDKGNCWKLLGTEYKLQKQRFYKIVNAAIQQWQAMKQKAIADQVHANTTEQLKSAVMDKQERYKVLKGIATGRAKAKKTFVIAGKIVEHPSEPDFNDRLKAIAEMNKMEGDYAPTKIAQTDKDGNDAKPPLTDEQVDKILSKINDLKANSKK